MLDGANDMKLVRLRFFSYKDDEHTTRGRVPAIFLSVVRISNPLIIIPWTPCVY